MRLLCLSNGHGEDTIALQILKALRQLPNAPTIEVLPIVGEGHAYQKQGFSIIGTVKAMPSGGFIYMDRKQLANDLQGGLLTLTLDQLKTVRQWSKDCKRKAEPAIILAVGDIVPLLFAWQSGLNYSFIGTAKSEYYLRDEAGWHPRQSWWDDRLAHLTGGVYLPWERWLMSRPNCKAIFPRDRITTQTLTTFGLSAYDFGNPMMDLEAQPIVADPSKSLSESLSRSLTILLLPGSRAPEAYRNWDVILSGLQNLAEQFDNRRIEFLTALSGDLDRTIIHNALIQNNWKQTNSADQYSRPDRPYVLTLGMAKFSEYAHAADLAIAMAGTATEQFIGLGKPAITLPGQGPQFTPAFAEAQTRLLGRSIIYVKEMNQLASTLRQLLQDSEQLTAIAHNGPQRMGKCGAADRIAHKLVQILSNP